MATGSFAQRSIENYILSPSAPDGQFRNLPPVPKAGGVAAGAQAAPADAGGGAQPSGPVPAMGTGLGAEYRIGANNLLDIEVLNVENGKRSVRVNAAGYVSLPLIGSVTLAGLTQHQAEEHIASMYAQKYLQDPQVSVFIKEFTTQQITLDGAVGKPGIYPIVGEMTLLRALAMAGGPGRIAKATEVKVYRQGQDGARRSRRSTSSGSAPARPTIPSCAATTWWSSCATRPASC
ncbi:polysaccharide export protein [Ramlibacter terrae]|uniref:Polysaccharide export protein n=1 Tax=Ramlibacter terrae TaxID=2732511 RepID=A0ABX6P3K3_9BURK|nr:polysaccharide export protein [Ramlibacter terrae]